MKNYYLMTNVGLAKYVLNYHDGVKKHADGSNFYDIAIFKNKQKLQAKIDELVKEGYKERGFYEH